MLAYLLQLALVLLSDPTVRMTDAERSSLQSAYEQQDEAKLKIVFDEAANF